MVDENLDLIQQESEIRMRTLDRMQNPQRPAFLDDPIPNIYQDPVQSQPEPPAIETVEEIGFARPTELDPKIVRDAYNENPFVAGAASAIYGYNQMEQAVTAWENGVLGEDQEFTPLPSVQLIAEATGEPIDLVGDFLYRNSVENGRFSSDLLSVIGPVRYGALQEATKKYGNATTLDFDDRPWWSKFGSDLGNLATQDVLGGEIAKAGGFGALSGMFRSIENMGTALSKTGVGQALNLGENQLLFGMKFEPKSDEEVAWLEENTRDSFTDFLTNRGGFQVGKTSHSDISKEKYEEFMATFRPEEEWTGYGAAVDSFTALKDAAVAEIDSGTGRVLAELTEFGAVYLATPQFMKASKVYAAIVNGTLKSGVAGQVIFEEGDDTITGWFVDAGIPVGPLDDWLNIDEDDSAVMARMKFALEDAAVGTAFELMALGLVSGIRALKRGDLEEASKKFDEGLQGATKEVSEETRAWYNELRARVEAGDTETRPLTAEEIAPGKQLDGQELREVQTQFAGRDPRDPIQFTRIATETSNGWTQYAKDGRFYDVDANNPESSEILKAITGRDDFVSILKDPGALTYDIFQSLYQRLRGAAGQIQAPKDREIRAAETAAVLDEWGMDILDPDMRGTVDPTKWSDSGEANLRAAVTMQGVLREEIMRLDYILKDLDPTNDVAKAKKLATEKLILQQRILELQLGVQKIAADTGRTLRAFGKINEISDEAIREQKLEIWRRTNGIVDASPIREAKERVKAYEAADLTARSTGKKGTIEAGKVASEPTKQGWMDSLRRVTSGWLLGNPKTQSMIFFSNFMRVVIGPVFEKASTGLIVEPVTALANLLKGQKGDAAEAIRRSGQQIQSALLYWPTMARFVPEAFSAWGRYWQNGMSDFLQTADLDEAYQIGKSLKEMNNTLGSQAVYRFMGSMDESFKELMVRTEHAIRAKQGFYGPELAKKNVWDVTPEDITRVLRGKPDPNKPGEFIGENPDAVEGTGGRLSDGFVIDDTRRQLFQQDAQKDSIKSWVERQVHNQSKSAQALRMLVLRFTTAPLSIMEFTFMNISAPFVLLADTRILPGNREKWLKGFNFFMGRYANDLNSSEITVRQRARGILALSSLFQGIGLYLGVTGMASKFMETQAESNNYLDLKRTTDDTKRFMPVMDLEGNINPIMIWAGVGDLLRQGLLDPEDAFEPMEALSFAMAVTLNSTLEKGSLGPLRETLDIFNPDGTTAAGAMESMAISQISTLIPYNFMQKRLFGWAGNVGREEPEGYDGTSRDFFERLGKTIPAFKPLTGAVLNKRRNALGELLPPSTGMFPIGAPLQPYNPVLAELEDIKEKSGYDFAREKFSYETIEWHREKHSDGQSVYDRAQQLISDGKVTIGGLTLYEALEAKMKDVDEYIDPRNFQVYSFEQRPRTEAGKKRASLAVNRDKRIAPLRRVFDAYREKAVQMSFAELPESRRLEIEELREDRMYSEEELMSWMAKNR